MARKTQPERDRINANILLRSNASRERKLDTLMALLEDGNLGRHELDSYGHGEFSRGAAWQYKDMTSDE